MNAKKILLIISMMLLPAFPVLAADGSFEGDLNVTGEWSNQSGNKAKLNEYRDMRKQGLYGGFLLKYDSDAFFLQGQASDIGYDTQHYRLDGGAYGKFKLYMDYNEIPHNFTYDARTFYNGVGSNNLTYTVAPTADTSSWTHFDYLIKRKTSEGGFSVNILKPFYFNVSASREERTGTMPTPVASTSPGGGAIELPQPVDYITDTVKAEVGYAKKPFFASLSAEYSTFDNLNHVLYFRNPNSGVQPNGDALNLPPSNQYYKIAFKGSANLPLNSKFNVNLGTSRAESEADLFSSYFSSAATPYPVILSSTLFHGLVDTNNADVVLTSNPLSFLNTRIYYKYYQRENRSDTILVNSNGTMFTNELFSYEKNSYGIDLGFKLPAHFYLRTAYAYLQTHRTRGDLSETRDNLYSIDLKWSGIDFMTTKVGYEHLQRGADHGVAVTVLSGDQATENAVGPFLSRFDAAAQYRDTLKASLDIYPVDNLNINLGYKYKRTDYMNTVLGLRNVTAHQANVDAGYAIGRIAKLNAYADYESNRSYQFQRLFANWDVRIKDDSYAYGANAEIFIVPTKLTLVLQYDHVNSNGQLDFTYLAGPPGDRTNQNIDIGAWDDYTLRSVMAKVVYTPWKPLTMVAGYAYQSYSYDDAAWNGYRYVVSTSYLTGAYANPSYHANVVFVSANYRF